MSTVTTGITITLIKYRIQMIGEILGRSTVSDLLSAGKEIFLKSKTSGLENKQEHRLITIDLRLVISHKILTIMNNSSLAVARLSFT
jgi:hypothetical protein